MNVTVDYDNFHGDLGADGERRVTATVEIVGHERTELEHVRISVTVDVAEPGSGTLREIESALLEAAAVHLRSAAALSLSDLERGLRLTKEMEQRLSF
ncbi:hypothetical protein [Paradevosia shaoguanensis]|uniref:hypothetical protein n=1 Tax=Paradevosia shaoguanensis TaxID=1335043 RepID=UPI003C7886CF